MGWFPWVGLLLGSLLAATAWLLCGHAPPGLVAVAVVALHALLTGGLHLDGLADVFDGLGGGRGDRQRTLQIMRDSRIGPHGAAALALCLVAKVVATSSLLERGQIAVLLVFPVVARSLAVAAMVLFRYGRAEGIGRPFEAQGRFVPLVLALAAGAGALAWLQARQHAALSAATGSLLPAVVLAIMMRRRLGGLTGDVYGAIIELAELGVLAGVVFRIAQ